MDAIECIRTRMSIRKYRPEAVPEDLLRSVIETAMWSPSYKNTQPWEVVIVSGEKRDELSLMLIDLFEKGTPSSSDIPEPDAWPAVLEGRIKELVRMRIEKTGVDLNAPEVRKKSKIANFRFYGAPHAIFVCQDGAVNEWSVLDAGMFCQSIMLAAHASGLGTVPQAFLTDYARQTKEFLGIPPSKRLVLGISIGYPDRESPVNSIRPGRAAAQEVLRMLR